MDYLADRLVALGESVPEEIPWLQAGDAREEYTETRDDRIVPRLRVPVPLSLQGRASLRLPQLSRPTSTSSPAPRRPTGRPSPSGAPGSNAFGAQEYGRPLFLAASADLSGSTNISGFAERYGDFPGYGWYERFGTADGVLLPQEITEFANAGIMVGMATVNFARDPEQRFDGFWGACSTYGSFSYLKYGPMRLFSQLAQDCQLKVGKVLWVAGHSGPETAEDSRTHFGIFSPGVTQLFPDGAIINLHPWEYNEVPVLLARRCARRRPSSPCT